MKQRIEVHESYDYFEILIYKDEDDTEPKVFSYFESQVLPPPGKVVRDCLRNLGHEVVYSEIY